MGVRESVAEHVLFWSVACLSQIGVICTSAHLLCKLKEHVHAVSTVLELAPALHDCRDASARQVLS